MLIDFCLKNGTRKVIDCDPNEKIKDVLPKIIRAFELERYSTIQLIYKGRKIAETDEIKNLNYIQNQIVIVNAQGLKPAESQSTSNSTPPETPATTPNPPPPPQVRPPQQQERPPPATNIQISLSHSRPPVPLPNQEDWENNLQFLIEMGYEEDLSYRALLQAYNQPERAVELLANDQVTSSPTTPPSSPQPATPQQPISSTPQTESQTSSGIPQYFFDQNRLSSNTNNDNDNVDNSYPDLPPPQSHPLPEVTYRPITDENRERVPQYAPDLFINRRNSSDIQIMADSPPTDPNIEADEELDLIRHLIIDNPRYIDNIINIIQENVAEDEDQNGQQNSIAEQMRANPKLLMHMFGIRKTDICHVPSSYTLDDITSIRRLYELGDFKWEQVIEAYENGEKNEELAEAFLLSLNVYD